MERRNGVGCAIPAARYACCGAGGCGAGVATGSEGLLVSGATAARFGDLRELVRVPPACSYNGESGPYAARIPLRKRVTSSFSRRTLSFRLADASILRLMT